MTSRQSVIRTTMFMSLSVVACASLFHPSLKAQAAPPVLAIEKNHFTVNGTPAFLKFFSYFAALRPTGSQWGVPLTEAQKVAHLSEVEYHFGLLKGYGIDGVRIFPNWAWSFVTINGCDVPDALTVMTPSAGAAVPSPIPGKPQTQLNANMLDVLDRVLQAAGRQQLIVELAWNNEQVRAVNPSTNAVLDRLTPDEYIAAMHDVTTQLAGRHPHMYMDLQNEYNYGIASGSGCPKDTYTGAGIGAILPSLRSIDRARKFTASVTVPPGQTLHQFTVNDAYNSNGQFDLVAYHDPRDWSGGTPLWPGQTGNHAYWLRYWSELGRPSSQWMPVIFSEPDRYLPSVFPNNQLTTAHFNTAVQNAKAQGAAAWTFHNQSFFKVVQSIPCENGVCQIATSVAPGVNPQTVELDFLSGLNNAVGGVSWGIPRPAGWWDAPSEGATVGQTFTISGWLLDQSAAGPGYANIQIWRSNTPGVPQVFVANATVVSRPDVAAVYGSEFVNSGFQATVTIPTGSHYLIIGATNQLNGVQSVLASRLVHVM